MGCPPFICKNILLYCWLRNLKLGDLLGLLYKAKGLHQEALKSFRKALDVEPNHVPSLISTACILRELGGQSLAVVRSFLTDALRLDRTNPSAWYNLGLLYKADIGATQLEAAECFEAAVLLEESAPVESFRWPILHAHFVSMTHVLYCSLDYTFYFNLMIPIKKKRGKKEPKEKEDVW